MKVKLKLSLFLFLIDLTDNNLFKIIIATNLFDYVYICIREMNDSSDTRDKRKN